MSQTSVKIILFKRINYKIKSFYCHGEENHSLKSSFFSIMKISLLQKYKLTMNQNYPQLWYGRIFFYNYGIFEDYKCFVNDIILFSSIPGWPYFRLGYIRHLVALKVRHCMVETEGKNPLPLIFMKWSRKSLQKILTS